MAESRIAYLWFWLHIANTLPPRPERAKGGSHPFHYMYFYALLSWGEIDKAVTLDLKQQQGVKVHLLRDCRAAVARKCNFERITVTYVEQQKGWEE